MSEDNKLHMGSADWRGQLKLNSRRTKVVIGLYILIYLALGLLIDTLIYSNELMIQPQQAFIALITLKLIPKVTIITVIIAIISLLISRLFYDRIMLLGTEYKEVTAQSTSLDEKKLYNVIEEMKVASGLKFMPKVYIIEADYMNAFASGISEKSAMVAITRGLFNKLDREELQAVMAHELSHIRHQDIKLTMTASVLSNIMLIIIDIIFYNMIFSNAGNDERRSGNNQLFFIIVLIRYILPVITVLLMLYLSRTREYMADSGCVELMRDNGPLARALLKIHNDHQTNKVEYAQAYGQTAHEDVRRAAYLYDPVSTGIEPVKSFASLFSTHPPIEKRLAAIGIKLNNPNSN